MVIDIWFVNLTNTKLMHCILLFNHIRQYLVCKCSRLLVIIFKGEGCEILDNIFLLYVCSSTAKVIAWINLEDNYGLKRPPSLFSFLQVRSDIICFLLQHYMHTIQTKLTRRNRYFKTGLAGHSSETITSTRGWHSQKWTDLSLGPCDWRMLKLLCGTTGWGQAY